MEENPFYGQWFAGVDRFLATADDAAVGQFVSACADSCSASYSRGVYERAAAASGFSRENPRALAAFLAELSASFADFAYEIRADGSVAVGYSRCLCDLVTEKGLSSPKLCLCSRESCRLNWEAAYGKGNVAVSIEKSVLRGDSSCLLVVRLAP
jgi:hypothetical protein